MKYFMLLAIACGAFLALGADSSGVSAAGSLSTVMDTIAPAVPESHGARQSIPDSLVQDVKTIIPAGIFFGQFLKEDGPFLIDGSVTVPSGQTLEFGPGTVVYIGGSYSTITVFGQIIARGSKDEPVTFMSARQHPNPWDWDRIYCRSRNRSVFEHCIVRHSNYGISVENGSVNISNCLFERNSLYGVAVKNSDISISETVFRGGQVMALLLNSGAVVTGDSLVINDNTTGIGCDGNAQLRLTRGSIAGNVNGIVVTPDASVSITGAEVTRNKVGVIAQTKIPQKSRNMIFANVIDEKIVTAEDVRRYLKEPEKVHSIVLPRTQAAVAAKEGFSPGFTAASVSEEQASSFIGNVTAGFRYMEPVSRRHPIQDTVYPQTLYPDGLQPEVQLFTSGKRGKTDVNLIMDIYSNQWLSSENSFGKNLFNLGLTYDNHTLSFGDFSESGSETSINGRQMTGIKYTGYYWDMGGGMRRMEYRLAAGESEVPKDSGHHDLSQYNVKVDSGMSMRQQITYIMATTLRPTRNTTFSAEGIIARDQADQPLFRAALTDPGAPRPIEAQTGCLSGTMSLLNGAMELFTEVDLGTHDTIDSVSARKVAWYNPELEDAVPKIFKNFMSTADFSDHYAITAGGKGIYKNCNLGLDFTEIAPHYFSAGNPYLEVGRRIGRCNANRQFSENASISAEYIYERTNSTGNPTDRNGINAKGEYAFGENKPALSLDYSSRLESNTSIERLAQDTLHQDSSISANAQFAYRKWTNIAGIEEKQNLQNGMSYSCSYQMLWDNDLSDHANIQNAGLWDRMQHQVSGWYSFKIKKVLRDKINFRVTLKDENRDSLRSTAYKFSDQLAVTVIPRKLNLTIAGELSRKSEKRFNVDSLILGWKRPVLTKFYGAEAEVKYSLTSRLSLQFKGRYEQSYDEVESSRENYDLKTAGLHLTYLF